MAGGVLPGKLTPVAMVVMMLTLHHVPNPAHAGRIWFSPTPKQGKTFFDPTPVVPQCEVRQFERWHSEGLAVTTLVWEYVELDVVPGIIRTTTTLIRPYYYTHLVYSTKKPQVLQVTRTQVTTEAIPNTKVIQVTSVIPIIETETSWRRKPSTGVATFTHLATTYHTHHLTLPRSVHTSLVLDYKDEEVMVEEELEWGYFLHDWDGFNITVSPSLPPQVTVYESDGKCQK